jgi:hypothetical protein
MPWCSPWGEIGHCDRMSICTRKVQVRKSSQAQSVWRTCRYVLCNLPNTTDPCIFKFKLIQHRALAYFSRFCNICSVTVSLVKHSQVTLGSNRWFFFFSWTYLESVLSGIGARLTRICEALAINRSKLALPEYLSEVSGTRFEAILWIFSHSHSMQFQIFNVFNGYHA